MTSLSMSKPLPHGFVDDMPEPEYYAHKGSLSVSGAKVLLKAPALFKWQCDHGRPNKTYFDIGHAAHKLILGVGEEIVVIDADDWRSKAAKDARDDAYAKGAIPLLRKEYEQVQAMADELSSHRLAMQLLSDGRPEVSAFALDEATGVLRRCRFDWLKPNIGVDYKSTICAEPRAFAASAAKFGYHQQQAYYSDIAADLGHPLDAFVFVCQEKTEPYLVTVVELDARSVARGRELNRQALERFRDCTESGIWPGYSTDQQVARVSLPRWAFYDNDADLEDIA